MASTNREDDLSKACAKVGRFLHDFALVEQEINGGIVQILDLKGTAADVIANSLDFIRKVNLFRTVALETAPEPEKEGVGKLFSAIAAQNDDRILMAHSTFELAADDGVQFRRTVAKDGKIKKEDLRWTKQKFEQSYNRLHDYPGEAHETTSAPDAQRGKQDAAILQLSLLHARRVALYEPSDQRAAALAAS